MICVSRKVIMTVSYTFDFCPRPAETGNRAKTKAHGRTAEINLAILNEAVRYAKPC